MARIAVQLLLAVAVAPAAARAAAARAPQVRGQPARKPNILFMMADQMRWDRLGVTANEIGPAKGVRTPALDRLASMGARFALHYSSTPTCTPARAAILTGQSPWNHGMLGAGTIARSYPFELPAALRGAGYSTLSIGKDHFGWDKHADLPPLDPAFDAGNKGSGVAHGYDRLSLYDGPAQNDRCPHTSPCADDYHQWFAREGPANASGNAESGWPYNINGWQGGPYMFEERLHPTAWVGQQAVDFLTNGTLLTNGTGKPWFLKVRGHTPADCGAGRSPACDAPHTCHPLRSPRAHAEHQPWRSVDG